MEVKAGCHAPGGPGEPWVRFFGSLVGDTSASVGLTCAAV